MATAMINIGLLRLTDAAPLVIAFEKGFFDRRGLTVQLSVEPSWANIADKLSYGRLQAAVMLPPLAFAIALGTRGIGAPLIVPMALSLNGNSITVANEILRGLAMPPGAAASETGVRLRNFIANAVSGCVSRSWIFIRRITSCCATGLLPAASIPSVTSSSRSCRRPRRRMRCATG